MPRYHLDKVAGGKSYAQVSALAQANPTDTKLAAQRTTLFQGETRRGLLLSAWGWSQVRLYAGYAAIAMTAGTIGGDLDYHAAESAPPPGRGGQQPVYDFPWTDLTYLLHRNHVS